MPPVFCIICGVENPDAANFCFACGAPIARGPRDAEQPRSSKRTTAIPLSASADAARRSAPVHPANLLRRFVGSFFLGVSIAGWLFAGLLDAFGTLLAAYLLWGVLGAVGALLLFPLAVIGMPLILGLQYGEWRLLLGPLTLAAISALVYGLGTVIVGRREPSSGVVTAGTVVGFLGLCLFWAYLSLLAGAVELVDPDGTARPLLTR
jgi:hypothetical protein